MAVSYNKLWKLMIDKKINKSQLCKKIKISSSTTANFYLFTQLALIYFFIDH